MTVNVLISGLDLILSVVFAVMILRQYLERKKAHQLMWGIAIVLWVIGVGAELAATVRGWGPTTYRAYYATGALLIPAWLGMGTLFLVLRRAWANGILIALTLLSLLGIVLIAIWPINSSALHSAGAQFVPLKVFPLVPVELILIVLNTFGAIAFVGGALWSVYHFARMQTMGERALATGLIAVGGLIAAAAHSLGVLGGIELFRVSELLALAFIFVGFVLSSRPAVQTAQRTGTARAAQAQ